MKNPNPINLKTDAHFRSQGWKFVARDKDGHAITVDGGDDVAEFKKFIATNNYDDLTVTRL